MKISISFLFLILLAAIPLTVVATEPEVIYETKGAGVDFFSGSLLKKFDSSIFQSLTLNHCEY
jgi:hypothetical protein